MDHPMREQAALILKVMATQRASREARQFVWSDQLIEDGEEFHAKYPDDSLEVAYVTEVAEYFETLGTLWKHELVSDTLLFDWVSAVPAWNRLASILREQRGRWDPKLWENFEALATAQQAAD